MVPARFLYIALFSIVVAGEETAIEPVCESKSANDINFDLSGMNLKRIRKLFVSGPSITCIDLAGNYIVNLERGAFDGLPELSYLNLARNPVSFEDFVQMNFPSLKSLVLDGPFENSNEGRYDNPEHDPVSSHYTREIYQPWDGETSRQLKNISSIFLPRLEKLSFRNYKADSVLAWLDHLNIPNLTHLNIGGNEITELTLPEAFLESLTSLNINDNKIGIFAMNLPELRYLSMDGNNLKTVCNRHCNWNSMSLRDLPNLEYLSLAGNEIESIEPDAFEYSDNLRVLNLAKNKMSFLPKHLLDSLKSLKNLSLEANELTEFPYVCEFKVLEVLNLRGNTIKAVDDKCFCNLSNLRYVDLSRNNLVNIPDGTFGQLPGLLELNLSWNNIASLPENWLGSGRVLHALYLDGNEFTDIANMSLESIEKLDMFSFSHNPLKTVTVRSVAKLPPDMKIDICHV